MAVFGGGGFLLGLVVMLFKGVDNVSPMQYVMIVAAIPLAAFAFAPGVDQPVSFTSVLFRFASIAYGGVGVFLELRSLYREARAFAGAD